MRQVKIEYENFERPENKELVAGIIETYSFLFPVWLKTLTVSVYDKHVDEDKWNAWNNGSPEYGTASIEMMVLCLDKSTQYLHELIAHELLHIAHMRVYELMHNRLMAGLEESNPDLYGFLKEDLRQEVEKFVENTAVGIVANAQGASATVTIHPPKPGDPYYHKWASSRPLPLREVPHSEDVEDTLLRTDAAIADRRSSHD